MGKKSEIGGFNKTFKKALTQFRELGGNGEDHSHDKKKI